MLSAPSELKLEYEKYLQEKSVQRTIWGVYKKWLRYYLDYCRKYRTSPKDQKNLPFFIKKLREKRQPPVQSCLLLIDH